MYGMCDGVLDARVGLVRFRSKVMEAVAALEKHLQFGLFVPTTHAKVYMQTKFPRSPVLLSLNRLHVLRLLSSTSLCSCPR